LDQTYFKYKSINHVNKKDCKVNIKHPNDIVTTCRNNQLFRIVKSNCLFTLTKTNPLAIKRIIPELNEALIIVNEKTVEDNQDIEKYRNIFLINKCKGGSETIKINIKDILKFLFNYEIGDGIAKVCPMISEKFNININNIELRNNKSKTLIEHFK
jgi:hypothetical protein